MLEFASIYAFDSLLTESTTKKISFEKASLQKGYDKGINSISELFEITSHANEVVQPVAYLNKQLVDGSIEDYYTISLNFRFIDGSIYDFQQVLADRITGAVRAVSSVRQGNYEQNVECESVAFSHGERIIGIDAEIDSRVRGIALLTTSNRTIRIGKIGKANFSAKADNKEHFAVVAGIFHRGSLFHFALFRAPIPDLLLKMGIQATSKKINIVDDSLPDKKGFKIKEIVVYYSAEGSISGLKATYLNPSTSKTVAGKQFGADLTRNDAEESSISVPLKEYFIEVNATMSSQGITFISFKTTKGRIFGFGKPRGQLLVAKAPEDTHINFLSVGSDKEGIFGINFECEHLPGISKKSLNQQEEAKINESPKKKESLEGSVAETGISKRKAKVVINTSRIRSEMKLVQHLINTYGWKEGFGADGDVLWAGKQLTPEDFWLYEIMRVNRIPEMSHIAHKKVTTLFLNIFRDYFPEDFDFFPVSFLVPEEISSLEKEFSKHKGALYCAKPTAGSHGDGIVLCRTMDDLPLKRFSTDNNYVVQRYIDKVLLVDKKKFDLRVYVLISSVNPFIAFINDEGLARFCTENYELPTKENLKNPYIHLTNYSLNKLSPKYVFGDEITGETNQSKRSFASLWKSLEKQGINRETIMKNIDELARKLLIGLKPFIKYNYRTAFGGKDTGKCFHVLGIDILIDEDLKPWLLEINANPSLNVEHDTEPGTKGVLSPIDLYVKSKVMEDAIMIVRKSAKKQLEMDSYGSYRKIFNDDDDEIEGMELIHNVLDIYGSLSGCKFKEFLTSSKFAKLASLPGLTGPKLTKPDYDLIFKKAVMLSDNNQMDFLTFLKAIELVAAKLNTDFDPTDKWDHVNSTVEKIMKGLKMK